MESWNPDEMVYGKDFIRQGSLHPGGFLKPPFHTYFSYFLVRLPFKAIDRILHLPRHSFLSVELILSRLLTVLLFLGAIVLVFYITKNCFGIFAARIISLIFSTSAGFIGFSHFLTADVPLTFWMLLALFASQRIFIHHKISDYALAGLFTGIATATKYNGLGIGISLIAAHALSLNSASLKGLLADKKLYVGLALVPLSFLAANPFALLDYPNFIGDFMYNFSVAPVYEGITTGHGYLTFLITWSSLAFLDYRLALSCRLFRCC